MKTLESEIARLRELYKYAYEYLHLDERNQVDAGYTESMKASFSTNAPTMMQIINLLLAQREELIGALREIAGQTPKEVTDSFGYVYIANKYEILIAKEALANTELTKPLE